MRLPGLRDRLRWLHWQVRSEAYQVAELRRTGAPASLVAEHEARLAYLRGRAELTEGLIRDFRESP